MRVRRAAASSVHRVFCASGARMRGRDHRCKFQTRIVRREATLSATRTTNTRVEIKIARHASAGARRAGDVKSCREDRIKRCGSERDAADAARRTHVGRKGVNSRETRASGAFTRTIKCFYNTLLRSRGVSLRQPARITTPFTASSLSRPVYDDDGDVTAGADTLSPLRGLRPSV